MLYDMGSIIEIFDGKPVSEIYLPEIHISKSIMLCLPFILKSKITK